MGTRRLIHALAPGLVAQAAAFTIHSISSVKFSAAVAAEGAAFLKIYLGTAVVGTISDHNVEMICVMTWKSLSKKPLRVARKKSRSRNCVNAKHAKVQALKQARPPSPAQPAVAVD